MDGNVWGGEVFVGDLNNLKRVAHIEYFSLPTSEMAIKEPWRLAFYFLYEILKEKTFDTKWAKKRKDTYDLENFRKVLSLKSPLTSSAGRLIDAVSSLLDVRDKITYEAQAAIELETIADEKENDYYKSSIGDNLNLNPFLLIEEVLWDQKRGVSPKTIAAKVFNTLVRWIHVVCNKMRYAYNIDHVVLSGGVFQNKFLFLKTYKLLKDEGFKVLFNKFVPINDSGISLGQATIAVLKEK